VIPPLDDDDAAAAAAASVFSLAFSPQHGTLVN
jgi:hypothetical protein